MTIKRETVAERKALPLASGVLDYFPDALLAVAEVSRVGNEQHHPGEPLHWDKSKSTDEADALLRHLLDRGTFDTDGLRHSGKVAWRALAMLQRELDAEDKAAANAGDAARLWAADQKVYGMSRDAWNAYWVATGRVPDVASTVPSELAVCEDTGNHAPGRHMLTCPDYS